jgi:4a-hydroxytetrahydrobiopterin dehydratase
MSSPLSKEQIEAGLSDLTGWKAGGEKLTKEFVFTDFREAMAFMVRVGFEAEAQAHHPEMFNVYNKVSIALATHDAGNKITEKDLSLAKAIDTLL